MARKLSEKKIESLKSSGVAIKDEKGKDVVPIDRPAEIKKPADSERLMATVTGVISSVSSEMVKGLKQIVTAQDSASKALVESQNNMVERVVDKIEEVKAIKLPDPPKEKPPVMKEFMVTFIKDQNDSMTGMTLKQTK